MSKINHQNTISENSQEDEKETEKDEMSDIIKKQNEDIIDKTLNDPRIKKNLEILTNNKITLASEDKFGNNRGFCIICKEACTSYTQSGVDDLSCGKCGCGASAHKLIKIEEFDLESFMNNLNNDFIPKLNTNIKESGLNFNSFVVIFKLLDPNANINQFSWLFQLFREANINILNMQVKKIRDNISVVNDKIYLNKYDLVKDASETQFIKIKDTTFNSLSKLEQKLKLMTFNEKQENQNIKNPENFYYTIQKLRGSALYDKFIQANMKSVISSNIPIQRKAYEDFKNPVLILCLSTNLASKNVDEDVSINFFEKFWFALMNSDKFINQMANNTLKLLYYSKNKINALWDVEIMFPQLFKADQIFQLLISKVRHEKNFDKSLSLYIDGLKSNSFRLSRMINFSKLSDLKRLTENNINSRNSVNRNIGKYVFDLYDNYINNARLQNQPCSIMQVSNIGVQKEVSDMTFSIAFNSDFIITRYDNEKECEEINNFFFSQTDVNSTSSYERILVIFRPFVIRSGLNEIFTNIFKINNFTILTRKIIQLNKHQISYLYHHEFPTEVKLPFNLYYNLMSDSNVELLIMAKYSAFVDAAAIIGLNKDNEVNVNQYNTVTNNLAYVHLYTPYEINPKRVNVNDPNIEKEYFERFIPKMNSSNSNLRSAQCFKDISSLVDIGQFLNDIMEEKMKFNNYNTYSMMHRLKTHLLQFASFFNLFVYANSNKVVSEEEINYFCPKYGDIQEVFLMTKNLDLIQNILLSLKFEIIDSVSYRLSEEEYDRLFSIYLYDNHGNTLITQSEYDINKQFLLENDIIITRLIKPGGFYELEKIVGNNNYLFIKIDNNLEKTIKDENENQTNVLIQTLKYNSYLLDNSINIEYFYPIVDDRIDKIEGGYIKLDYHEEPISIPDILQSCLKCSVAEDIRIDNKETIHNQNLIERYLNFYHFDYIENFENNEKKKKEEGQEFFLQCLRQYIYNYNDKDNNLLVNKFYETIKYNNLAFPNNLSYFVESTNLGFYEIRIPILDYYTEGGWNYINNMKYLLLKNYLYSDNDFYEQFIQKHRKRDKMVLLFFPYTEPNRKNNLEKFLNLKTLSEAVSSTSNTLRYNSVDMKMNNLNAIAEGNLSFNIEDNLNIQKRIFYLTKYEGTKMFYKICILNAPTIRNIPQSYHYRIKPDDIFMDINRIYEVEEFGGLFFIELVIQDFMKYRPSENNEIRENGEIRNYIPNNFYGIYDDNIQLSLVGFLWGRKLMQMCKFIEDFENNQLNPLKVENYGPVIYNPMKQKLMGMINEKNIKEYEIYLYINILDDIRYSNLVSNEDVEFLEKKLYEVFNSDIFNSSREKLEDIRFLPNRITEHNLRVNKSKKTNVIKDENSTFNNTIDPQQEMKFHTLFKENERDIEIEKNILSKNVYLVDLFCFNGMKYHMYAAILFLLEVYYKKLNKKVDLITMDVDEFNIYKSKEKEYDRLMEAIITGFKSHSYINYSANNDSNRYNTYNIEYFFYCLKELKFILNENAYLINQLNEVNKSLEDPNLTNLERRNELENIKNKMENNISKNMNDFQIIMEESKKCPLRQSEEDLDEFKYIYAPKERYYIPMKVDDKWERDLTNEKYILTQKIDYSYLRKLKRLNDLDERKTFSSTGFNIARDYYLIHKSMLREPEPPIKDKILLEKKKIDKTKKQQKIFENVVKNIVKGRQKEDKNTMFGILSQGLKKMEEERSKTVDIFGVYLDDNTDSQNMNKSQMTNITGGKDYNTFQGTFPIINNSNMSQVINNVDRDSQFINVGNSYQNITNNNITPQQSQIQNSQFMNSATEIYQTQYKNNFNNINIPQQSQIQNSQYMKSGTDIYQTGFSNNNMNIIPQSQYSEFNNTENYKYQTEFKIKVPKVRKSNYNISVPTEFIQSQIQNQSQNQSQSQSQNQNLNDNNNDELSNTRINQNLNQNSQLSSLNKNRFRNQDSLTQTYSSRRSSNSSNISTKKTNNIKSNKGQKLDDYLNIYS